MKITYSGGLRRYIKPPHPGIVWNRQVRDNKPGRVWNSRGTVEEKFCGIRYEKYLSEIVHEAKTDPEYRMYIERVAKAYEMWQEMSCEEDIAADFLKATIRLREEELGLNSCNT